MDLPNFFNNPGLVEFSDFSMLASGMTEQLNEIIGDFRTETLAYHDSLSLRIDTLLKANEKIEAKRILKDLRKKINGISEEQALIWLIQRNFSDSASAGCELLYQTGLISKEELRIQQKKLLQPSATPVFYIQQGFSILEKKLALKEFSRNRDGNSDNSIANSSIVQSPKNFDGIVRDFQGQVAKPRTLEETLGRIQTRLENIFNGIILEKHISELQKMESRLKNLQVQSHTKVADLSSSLLEIINGLLSNGVDTESFVPHGETHSENGIQKNGEIVVSLENQKFIEYIRYIRSEVITFKDSSKKGGLSVGDGNFIAHIWRPFLSRLEYLLQHNYMNAEKFAWNNIVETIYSTQDGINNRNRLKAFLDLLSGKNGSNNWQENWIEVLDVIELFSQNERFYFPKTGVSPLKNISDKLIQHSPSFE